MMETILNIATIASPIVGVIAIIVALIIACQSSKKAQKQIDAIYNLMDVFVASQTPDMLVALQKYEAQLEDLNGQIREAEEDFEIVNPFFGRGARIEDIEYLENKKRESEHIAMLQSEKEKIEAQIRLIKSYMEKSNKKK